MMNVELFDFAMKLKQIWIDEFAEDPDGCPCMCCGDSDCPDYSPCLHCKIRDAIKSVIGDAWYTGTEAAVNAAIERHRHERVD